MSEYRTYHIELTSGEATVYAPNKNRAAIRFFEYMDECIDNLYSIKKEKKEFNLYVNYGDRPKKLTINEVTEEGVITYVEH
jgi:hypothetical protein